LLLRNALVVYAHQRTTSVSLGRQYSIKEIIFQVDMYENKIIGSYFMLY